MVLWMWPFLQSVDSSTAGDLSRLLQPRKGLRMKRMGQRRRGGRLGEGRMLWCWHPTSFPPCLPSCPALFRLSGSMRNYVSRSPTIHLGWSRYLSPLALVLALWRQGVRQTQVPFLSPPFQASLASLLRPPLVAKAQKGDMEGPLRPLISPPLHTRVQEKAKQFSSRS